MKKKVLFTALLSCSLLVACGGDSYKKVTKEKVDEVLAANIAKEVTYKGATSSFTVTKLDVDISADSLDTATKDAFIAATKAQMLSEIGVEEVGKAVTQELTEDDIAGYKVVSIPETVEEMTVSYYVSGEKIKVVMEGENQGQRLKQTTFINENAWAEKIDLETSISMEQSGVTVSIEFNATESLSYKL